MSLLRDQSRIEASGASGAHLRSHGAADPVQNVGPAGNEFDLVTVLPPQVLLLRGHGHLPRRNVAAPVACRHCLHRLKHVAPCQ